jgi:hypothetical protein
MEVLNLFPATFDLSSRMVAQTFQGRFCAQRCCGAQEYEELAFRELLYGHARLLAIPVRKFKPRFFEADFQFIRDLGEATDLREAKVAAACFQDANAGRSNLLRKRLKLRVSGLKATKIAHDLFSSCHRA